MRVLIIGCGNMGHAISTRLVAGRHELVLFDRERPSADALATELTGPAVGARNVTVVDAPADAIPSADVVVLATPYGGSIQLAHRLGAALDGRVVVDICNPLNASHDALVTDPNTSAAEVLQRAMPGARVVKAFNTTFAPTLHAGEVAGQPLDVFIAGDHETATSLVAALVRSAGLHPVEVGALHHARQLEAMGLLAFTLQSRLLTHFRTGWKLLMPAPA